MMYTALLRSLLRAFRGEPPETPLDREDAGLILVADGVGGFDLCGLALRHVVPESGVPHVVRVMAWGHGLGRWHADLTDTAHLQAKATALAAEARRFHDQKPHAPVFLVGKSGGTGLVARALEQLPEAAVETVVLISPALSPGYNLTRALRTVRREMVVFWSPLDLIVLGLGTRIFGTIDGVKSASAGLVGFRPPEPLDPEAQAQYAKLRQVRWRPEMASTGYLGGHVGPDSPAFLQKYVVPLFDVARPDPPTQPPDVKPGARRADNVRACR